LDEAWPYNLKLMTAARKSLTENLQRLGVELDRFLEGHESCVLREARHGLRAQSMTASLPLGHSQGQATFRSTVRDGFLLSQAELRRRGRKIAGDGLEDMLGTADDVFTFVGSIRYPLTACALLFAAELERVAGNDAIATPFDSGGIVKHFKPTDGSERGAFLRRHELPVPEYRSYLTRMLSLFFQSPLDYVDGNAPDLGWPIAIDGGDWRRWTFEVRFGKRIPLSPGMLVGVVLPVALAATMAREIAMWQTEGVHVRFYIVPERNPETVWQVMRMEATALIRGLVQ
jgi:hypothetical protein